MQKRTQHGKQNPNVAFGLPVLVGSLWARELTDDPMAPQETIHFVTTHVAAAIRSEVKDAVLVFLMQLHFQ